LDYSWLHYIGCLEEGVANDDHAADMKEHMEWALRFIEVVQGNEPRFLIQQKFPSEYESLFSSCIQTLNKYDYRDCRPNDIDDLDRESEYLEELRSLCQDVSCIYPDLEDTASDVVAELGGQQDMVQEQRDRLEQKRQEEEEERARAHEEYDYYYNPPPPERMSQPPQHTSSGQRPSTLNDLIDRLNGVDPIKHLFDDL
jgi:hypothetical protein